MLRPIRKIASLFRGRVSPALGGLCVGLGWWWGFIPGLYGIHFILFLLAILLNIPLGAFIVLAAIGKASALLMAPVLYHAGRILCTPLSWLWQAMSKVPVLALTDLDRPAIIGALTIGPLIGLILGIAVAMAIAQFRRLWLALEERSDRFKLWQSKWCVRLAEWILLGPRAKDARAALEIRPVYIRRSGLVVICILLAATLLGEWLVGSRMVKDKTRQVLTRLNGATVDLNDLDLSWMGGKVDAKGLAFTDPERPSHNSFQVGQAVVDLDLYQLSVGRIVVDRAMVYDVGLDRPRATPGQVLPKEPEDPNARPWRLPEIRIDWSTLARLDQYLQDANKIRIWLQKIRPYLPSGFRPPPKRPQRYLEYLSARQERPRVRFIARHVEVNQIQLPQTVFGRSGLAINNISDAPYLTGLPIELSFQSELGTRLEAMIQWQDAYATIKGTISGIDLARLQSVLRQDNPVRFQAGLVEGRFEGRCDGSVVDIRADLKVSGLRLAVGQDGLFGLDAKTVSELLATIDHLELPFWVRGPLDDPRIGLETKGLAESLKKGLIDAGRKKVLEQVQKEADKRLGGKVPDGVGDLLGPALDRAGLGGLLGRPKEPNRP